MSSNTDPRANSGGITPFKPSKRSKIEAMAMYDLLPAEYRAVLRGAPINIILEALPGSPEGTRGVIERNMIKATIETYGVTHPQANGGVYEL